VSLVPHDNAIIKGDAEIEYIDENDSMQRSKKQALYFFVKQGKSMTKVEL